MDLQFKSRFMTPLVPIRPQSRNVMRKGRCSRPFDGHKVGPLRFNKLQFPLSTTFPPSHPWIQSRLVNG